MNDAEAREMARVTRRDFLKWMGIGTGAAAIAAGSLHYFRPADAGDNPLARSVNRDWEKIYRNQYEYDRAFDWVCAPNDTHNCRITRHVRNGIVTRMGEHLRLSELRRPLRQQSHGQLEPRHCAKGYTFHRILYGPYRLKHPIVRRGWKRWADDGFPELTPEIKAQYIFDSRGTDKFERISWDDAFDYIARALMAIARATAARQERNCSLAQGYPPEMIEDMGGAGTRTIKMRGGMGLARRASASTACTASAIRSRCSTCNIRGVEARGGEGRAHLVELHLARRSGARPSVGAWAAEHRDATSTICASRSSSS